MKFLHEQLKLKTVSNRPSYHNITSDVKKIFEKSQINNGVVIVSSPHTTCSVYFDEYMHDVNYYGDDLLQVDLNEVLEKIIPTQTTEDNIIALDQNILNMEWQKQILIIPL